MSKDDVMKYFANGGSKTQKELESEEAVTKLQTLLDDLLAAFGEKFTKESLNEYYDTLIKVVREHLEKAKKHASVFIEDNMIGQGDSPFQVSLDVVNLNVNRLMDPKTVRGSTDILAKFQKLETASINYGAAYADHHNINEDLDAEYTESLDAVKTPEFRSQVREQLREKLRDTKLLLKKYGGEPGHEYLEYAEGNGLLQVDLAHLENLELILLHDDVDKILSYEEMDRMLAEIHKLQKELLSVKFDIERSQACIEQHWESKMFFDHEVDLAINYALQARFPRRSTPPDHDPKIEQVTNNLRKKK